MGYFGIVFITGYDAGAFRPKDNITREQAMAMTARAMKITGLTAETPAEALAEFADASAISSYALDGVEACVSAGLVSGRGNAIAPRAQITRAEVAVMIQRLLQESELIN